MPKAVTRALIFDEQGRILLGKRARGHGAEKWALVGGKPEEGETMEACVIREVREELGVEFTPALFLELDDAESDPPHIWKVCYYKGPIRGEFMLKPDEISEIGFFSAEDAEKLSFAFSHNRKIVLHLLKK